MMITLCDKTVVLQVSLLLIYGSASLDYWPVWCEVLTFLSHLLLVFNSSVNILIYCWKDQKFRSGEWRHQL